MYTNSRVIPFAWIVEGFIYLMCIPFSHFIVVFESGARNGNKDSRRRGYSSCRVHAIASSGRAVISIR